MIFLAGFNLLINIVIDIRKKYCVIGSVVTHRPTVAKDASSRLVKARGILFFLKIVHNVCARIYIIDVF